MRPLLKAALLGLGSALLYLAFAKLDPWGFETATAQAADDLQQRLASTSYPRQAFRVAAPQREHALRVIYIDEATIQGESGLPGWKGFPPTPAEQAAMIGEVADNLRPAAGCAPGDLARRCAPGVLFLDFTYVGRGVDDVARHPGFSALVGTIAKATHAQQWRRVRACRDDPLTRLACMVATGGVPVILGKPRAFSDAPLTPVQQALEDVALVAPLEIRNGRYPVGGNPDGRYGDRYEPSPATAAYAAWCFSNSKGSDCGDPLLKGIYAAAAAAISRHGAGAEGAGPDATEVSRRMQPLGDMNILWGVGPSPLQLRLDQAVASEPLQCWPVRHPALLPWLTWVVRGSRAFEAQDWNPADRPCAYPTSASYLAVISQVYWRPELKDEFFSPGSVVMMGVKLPDGNDWVDNPIVGKVPGVALHAMATDNLIQRGLAGYRLSDPPPVNSDLVAAVLCGFLAALAPLAPEIRKRTITAARSRGRTRMGLREFGAIYLLTPAAFIGVTLLTIILAIAALPRTPINWIAILMLWAGETVSVSFGSLREDLAVAWWKLRPSRDTPPNLNEQ